MDYSTEKEVWLVGKGPSYDYYDWSQAGDERICINEMVFIVPSPTAAIAIDYDILNKYVEAKLQVPVLLKSSHANRYSFQKQHLWDKHTLPLGCTATAPIAIQLLHMAGARIIHFVGFDAISGDASYAAKVQQIDACGHSVDGYARINKHILEAIESLGIEAIWEK